jgi:uncharacterized protein (TIGR02246 family)
MANDWAADRFELQDVMARYAKGVDERDMDLYASCFAEDVHVTGFGEEELHGRDAWVAYVKQALERFGATQHMLGPQLATVDGDTAHCRTDVQARHYMIDQPDTTLTLWATYETDMSRIDGTWKISKHHLVSRGTRIQQG